MRHALDDFVEACSDEGAQPCALVSDVMHRLGFKAHMYAHSDHGTPMPDWGDYDRGHLRATMEDPAFADDPMAIDATASWDPILWEAADYANSGRTFVSLYRRSLDIGYLRGLACQVRGPGDYRGFFVAVFEGSATAMQADRAALCNAMTVVGPWAARASFQSRRRNDLAGVSLTAREAECLEWALNGKTAWETSHILSINDRTVNFHLQNAMRKLNVHNKQQAGRKAASLGLLNIGNVYRFGGSAIAADLTAMAAGSRLSV